jgi:hypothetical protein
MSEATVTRYARRTIKIDRLWESSTDNMELAVALYESGIFFGVEPQWEAREEREVTTTTWEIERLDDEWVDLPSSITGSERKWFTKNGFQLREVESVEIVAPAVAATYYGELFLSGDALIFGQRVGDGETDPTLLDCDLSKSLCMAAGNIEGVRAHLHRDTDDGRWFRGPFTFSKAVPFQDENVEIQVTFTFMLHTGALTFTIEGEADDLDNECVNEFIERLVRHIRTEAEEYVELVESAVDCEVITGADRSLKCDPQFVKNALSDGGEEE